MKKNILPLLLIISSTLISVSESQAQKERNVVIEHFTNTRCGICGNRNPGLFTNLASSPEVMHVSYHPSRPYASCELNKHNVSGNDDRANFYGVYGSTPRVVVQGNVKGNGESFTSKDLFKAEQGKMTPLDIKITTLQKGKDSLKVRIVVTNVTTNSLSNMSLYAIAVEDTVFYNAPNGESQHHNVFRKVLANQALTIPATVGDSMVYEVKTQNHTDWDASRMYVMAFAMTSDKKVEQVASSKGDADVDEGGGTNAVDQIANSQFTIYPNPANGLVTIESKPGSNIKAVTLTDVLGNVVLSVLPDQGGLANVDVSALPAGTYFTRVELNSGVVSSVQRLVVLH